MELFVRCWRCSIVAALPLSTRRLLFIAIMEIDAVHALDAFADHLDKLDQGIEELDFDKMRELGAMCDSAVTEASERELQESNILLHGLLNDIVDADNKRIASTVKEEEFEEAASAVNTVVVADDFQFAEEEQHAEEGPDILESAGLQNTSGRNSMTAQHTE